MISLCGHPRNLDSYLTKISHTIIADILASRIVATTIACTCVIIHCVSFFHTLHAGHLFVNLSATIFKNTLPQFSHDLKSSTVTIFLYRFSRNVYCLFFQMSLFMIQHFLKITFWFIPSKIAILASVCHLFLYILWFLSRFFECIYIFSFAGTKFQFFNYFFEHVLDMNLFDIYRRNSLVLCLTIYSVSCFSINYQCWCIYMKRDLYRYGK